MGNHASRSLSDDNAVTSDKHHHERGEDIIVIRSGSSKHMSNPRHLTTSIDKISRSSRAEDQQQQQLDGSPSCVLLSSSSSSSSNVYGGKYNRRIIEDPLILQEQHNTTEAVPDGICTETSSSSSSSAGNTSTPSLASVVEQYFLVHRDEEEEQPQRSFDPIDADKSSVDISSRASSLPLCYRTQQHPQTRRKIFDVYQTYSTKLVPRGRHRLHKGEEEAVSTFTSACSSCTTTTIPESFRDMNGHENDDDDNDSVLDVTPLSIHRSHIPFRKCHRWDCECHNNNTDVDTTFSSWEEEYRNIPQPPQLKRSAKTAFNKITKGNENRRVSCSSSFSTTANHTDQTRQQSMFSHSMSSVTADTGNTRRTVSNKTNCIHVPDLHMAQRIPTIHSSTSRSSGCSNIHSSHNDNDEYATSSVSKTKTTIPKEVDDMEDVAEVGDGGDLVGLWIASSPSPITNHRKRSNSVADNEVTASTTECAGAITRSRANSVSGDATTTRNQRARSEDYIDGGSIFKIKKKVSSAPKFPPSGNASGCNNNGTSSSSNQRVTSQGRDLCYRARVQSHDLSANSTSKSVRETIPKGNVSTNLQDRDRSRCRSEDYVDGSIQIITTGTSQLSSTPSSRKRMDSIDSNSIQKVSRAGDSFSIHSPTSVATTSIHKDIGQSSLPILLHPTKIPHEDPVVKCDPVGTTALEESLSRLRSSITEIKRHARCIGQNKQERAMALAKTYYHMGLLHYQLCRYETALHVLDFSIETLLQSVIPKPETNLTYESNFVDCDADDDDDLLSLWDSTPHPSYLPLLSESLGYLSNQELLLVANIATAQANIHCAQGSWLTAKNRAEQVLLFYLGSHEQNRRNIGRPTTPVHYQNKMVMTMLSAVHNDIATNWALTVARAQVVIGQVFQHEQRPDLAMRCYEDALGMQRFLWCENTTHHHHVDIANTLHRMGDLHTSQGFLDAAASCYHEALRIYKLPQYARIDVCTADAAAVMASLGWISLLQYNFAWASSLTNQALDDTIRTMGPSHRNVASMRYQLPWITWWSQPQDVFSATEIHRAVLNEWKRVLKHQEQVCFVKRVSSSDFKDGEDNQNHGNGALWNIQNHRHYHLDVAKTLHAMGHAYHALGRTNKAHTIFSTAATIFQVNRPSNGF